MFPVLCLVLLSLAACSTVRGDWCEPNTRHNCSCTVTATRTTVDCSNQNIDSCNIDIPTNVTELIIANNQIPQINNTCLTMFMNLTMLDMSNNIIESIEKSSFIQCGTGYSHCSIQSLTNNTFVNLQPVEFLNMSACNISAIEMCSFVPLTNLKALDLSNNRDLKFKTLPNITYGLQFSKTIEALYLNFIHQSGGIGTVVRNYDIRFLKNTTLRELYIDDNRIEQMENCVIRNLRKSLEVISVNGNQFKFGHYLCEGEDFVSLKTLSMNRQHLCRTIHITDNVDLYCEQEHTSNVNAVLDINEYNTSAHDECTKCTSTYCSLTTYCIPRTLEELYMRDSLMLNDLYEMRVNDNNSRMKTLDLSSNRLTTWSGPIMNVKLEYLDLSNNLCENVHKEFFRNQSKMRTLLLDDNLIGLNIEQHTDGQLFNDLHSLSELRFSKNRLPTLPVKLFTGLVQLHTLNLSFNFIPEFDVEVAHMKHLQLLDLSYNQLSTIPDQNRKVLLEISKTSPLTIDLTKNTLRCTCSNLEFLEWMLNPTLNFTGVENYNCSDEDGNITTLGNLHDKISDMKQKCATYTVLIIVTSIGIATAVTVIMAAVLNRYKWKLRYIFYKNWNRHRRYEAINETERENYRYDAFISYAESDVRFVRYRLVEYLENNFHLKLCVHDRDFLAGNAVAANIVDAISTSYKTVVVMSERFLRSHWCMYELNMARMESLHSREGRSVVFIVMLEAVDTSRLPLEVMDLVQNQCYLEYPNDPNQGDIVFLDRLRDAIVR